MFNASLPSAESALRSPAASARTRKSSWQISRSIPAIALRSRGDEPRSHGGAPLDSPSYSRNRASFSRRRTSFSRWRASRLACCTRADALRLTVPRLLDSASYSRSRALPFQAACFVLAMARLLARLVLAPAAALAHDATPPPTTPSRRRIAVSSRTVAPDCVKSGRPVCP